MWNITYRFTFSIIIYMQHNTVLLFWRLKNYHYTKITIQHCTVVQNAKKLAKINNFLNAHPNFIILVSTPTKVHMVVLIVLVIFWLVTMVTRYALATNILILHLTTDYLLTYRFLQSPNCATNYLKYNN